MNDLETAIQALMEGHKDADPKEIRAMITKTLKANRVAAIQQRLRGVVAEHKGLSLTRLRREIKKAYEHVNATDDSSDDEQPSAAVLTPYRKFVKEQSLVLKEEMPDADQRERMIEIAKRWADAKKQPPPSPPTPAKPATTAKTSKNKAVVRPRRVAVRSG